MKTAQNSKLSDKKEKYTLFFKDIEKEDTPIVGGKGANLGEMTQADFPVPNGFCITVKSYKQFLTDNGIDKKIYDILNAIDVNDSEQLDSAAKRAQQLIKNGKVSNEIKREIVKSYKKLSGHFSSALVAVRSSATAEDLANASFAGQQVTLLNVKGDANLVNAVRECWASLFMPRSVFYRTENHIAHEDVFISVVVQKMIQSEVSGVMFSIDPVTNDKDKIIIEAVWGLGEMIVQGAVIPDRYVVQKGTFSILSKEISNQHIQLKRTGAKTFETNVPKNIIDNQKITDNEIVYLAKIAQKLQDHYYFPQDSEWAKEKGKLYIVQTRPVTTTKEKTNTIIKDDKSGGITVQDTPILTGLAASFGSAIGPVKILKDSGEISKVQTGDVLVAKMTSPDYVPAMKKAVAIVTDEGGATSHAAIVSRELGVPCVVGTKNATKILKENQVVSVDGKKGLVYLGSNTKLTKEEVKTSKRNINTATKIYVNLAEPELANKVAKEDVDGVGLLRAEFMIANIGIHPKEAIKNKVQDSFVDKLTQGISKFCKEFYPRPVVYRATDFKTNEYRMLDGGKKWEPQESNPMLGYRGAFRYTEDPEVFTLELRALKEVQKHYDNIKLMIPFVRSPEELSRVRRLVYAEGLFNEPKFQFWMMVEIPVNVIQIEDFIKVGIDGVSIGSNDLTMLVTGTDRDNSEVAKAFDERTPAVLWAIRRTIKKCQKHGVTVSICGQAPSIYDEYAEKLVKYGITSISVNPDSIYRVRELVKNAESKLLK